MQITSTKAAAEWLARHAALGAAEAALAEASLRAEATADGAPDPEAEAVRAAALAERNAAFAAFVRARDALRAAD